MVDMVEEEKSILDDKLLCNKFAFIILKHQYYNSLETGFANFNKNTKEAILKTRELEKHIISMAKDD